VYVGGVTGEEVRYVTNKERLPGCFGAASEDFDKVLVKLYLRGVQAQFCGGTIFSDEPDQR
jgi:hypothetical protein